MCYSLTLTLMTRNISASSPSLPLNTAYLDTARDLASMHSHSLDINAELTCPPICAVSLKLTALKDDLISIYFLLCSDIGHIMLMNVIMMFVWSKRRKFSRTFLYYVEYSHFTQNAYRPSTIGFHLTGTIRL